MAPAGPKIARARISSLLTAEWKNKLSLRGGAGGKERDEPLQPLQAGTAGPPGGQGRGGTWGDTARPLLPLRLPPGPLEGGGIFYPPQVKGFIRLLPSSRPVRASVPISDGSCW